MTTPYLEGIEDLELLSRSDWKGPPGAQRPGRPRKESKEYVPRQNAAESDLFNDDKLPHHREYKGEKAEHRHVAFLKAQGHSGVEIAKITGYSLASVYNILRQPWIRDIVLEEIRRSGRSAVEEVLSAGAMDAVHALQDVITSDKVKPADRIAASKHWLDRVFGTPNQSITVREEIKVKELTDEELSKIIAGPQLAEPSCADGALGHEEAGL